MADRSCHSFATPRHRVFFAAGYWGSAGNADDAMYWRNRQMAENLWRNLRIGPIATNLDATCAALWGRTRIGPITRGDRGVFVTRYRTVTVVRTLKQERGK